MPFDDSIVSGTIAEITRDALSLIRARGSLPFPVTIQSNPINGEPCFRSFEAQQILMFTMLAGKWQDLVAIWPGVVPNPADTPANYVFSRDWPLWPGYRHSS